MVGLGIGSADDRMYNQKVEKPLLMRTLSLSYRLPLGSDTNYLWVLNYLYSAPDRAVV